MHSMTKMSTQLPKWLLRYQYVHSVTIQVVMEWTVANSVTHSCINKNFVTHETPITSHFSLTEHYSDVIINAMTSQITIVFSTVCSGANQRKHQSPRHWPLWGEFTGDRWIPRSKGREHRQRFYWMKSSCTRFSSTKSKHRFITIHDFRKSYSW